MPEKGTRLGKESCVQGAAEFRTLFSVTLHIQWPLSSVTRPPNITEFPAASAPNPWLSCSVRSYTAGAPTFLTLMAPLLSSKKFKTLGWTSKVHINLTPGQLSRIIQPITVLSQKAAAMDG